VTRKDILNSESSTLGNEDDIREEDACKILQRHQHYYKLQMLEMLDIETREKEV
jgi:hypothetical protein